MPIADIAKFETTKDGVIIVAPCVEVVFDLDLTEDEHLLDFYHRSREVLGDQITHYQAASMTSFSKLTARSESMFSTWFTTPAKGKLDYYMSLSQGDPNAQASASTIYLMVFRRPLEELTDKDRQKWASTFAKTGRQGIRAATNLRLTLPVDHPLAQSAELIEWIQSLKLVQASSSFTGYAGVALNHYDQAVHPGLNNPARQALASLVTRHPGLGWTGASTAGNNSYDPKDNMFRLLVKRANWLNLVCDHSLEPLGGRSAVLDQVKANPDLHAIELKHGLAIQAGGSPQIGDIARYDFIPVYRQVAAILKPIRIPKIGGLGGPFMSGATNEWLNAFDKEHE